MLLPRLHRVLRCSVKLPLVIAVLAVLVAYFSLLVFYDDHSVSLAFLSTRWPKTSFGADKLDKAERIFEGQIKGPESLAVHRATNTVFTGLKDGSIVQLNIHNEKILNRFWMTPQNESSSCDGSYESMAQCGRPLGMRFSPIDPDLLAIVDAYYGLFEYNVVTKQSEWLYDATSTSSFFNDFDFTADGDIIISEPSSTYSDRDFPLAFLDRSRADGSVYRLARTTKSLRRIYSGLSLPNGIQMDSASRFFFLAEFGSGRVLRCHPEGLTPCGVFVDDLPCHPDNIRLSTDGRFLLIPCPIIRRPEHAWTVIVQYIMLQVLKLHHNIMEWAIAAFNSPESLVIVADSVTGDVVAVWFGSSNEVAGITQVLQTEDGTCLLSNDDQQYVGRVSCIDGL